MKIYDHSFYTQTKNKMYVSKNISITPFREQQGLCNDEMVDSRKQKGWLSTKTLLNTMSEDSATS